MEAPPLAGHTLVSPDGSLGLARYLLVALPRIFRLVEELHEPAEDFAAIFRKYESELLANGRAGDGARRR